MVVFYTNHKLKMIILHTKSFSFSHLNKLRKEESLHKVA